MADGLDTCISELVRMGEQLAAAQADAMRLRIALRVVEGTLCTGACSFIGLQTHVAAALETIRAALDEKPPAA